MTGEDLIDFDAGLRVEALLQNKIKEPFTAQGERTCADVVIDLNSELEMWHFSTWEWGISGIGNGAFLNLEMLAFQTSETIHF